MMRTWTTRPLWFSTVDSGSQTCRTGCSSPSWLLRSLSHGTTWGICISYTWTRSFLWNLRQTGCWVASTLSNTKTVQIDSFFVRFSLTLWHLHVMSCFCKRMHMYFNVITISWLSVWLLCMPIALWHYWQTVTSVTTCVNMQCETTDTAPVQHNLYQLTGFFLRLFPLSWIQINKKQKTFYSEPKSQLG